MKKIFHTNAFPEMAEPSKKHLMRSLRINICSIEISKLKFGKDQLR
jgi:hypothetical protein